MFHPSGTIERTAHRSTLLADAAVLGIAVVWGASYPVTKSALAYAPVLVLIFYRFVATACIMGLAARRGSPPLDVATSCAVWRSG